MVFAYFTQSLPYVASAIGILYVLKGLLQYFGLFIGGRPPLPPGPKPLPFIGNYLDLPKTKDWLTMDRWFKRYGDMVYYRVFDQGVLILGSLKGCQDTFEKRSAIYSGRPQLVMLGKLSGWDFAFSNMSYGRPWRTHRQAFHQHFNQNMVPKYRSVQIKNTHSLLRCLLATPNAAQKLAEALPSTFTGIIMDVVYGYTVTSTNDPYIKIIERAQAAFSESVKPGRFLVETFPFLQYIPSWVPGAGFKRLAKQWRIATISMIEIPFEWAKSEMSRGKPSIVASMLQKISDKKDKSYEESARIMKNAAAMASIGPSGTCYCITSRAAVTLFILAMAMHPNVQEKAQAEIDSVVGTHRLPNFSDRESLPYVNAIIKETLRWQNVSPLNDPHLLTEDDVYNGYFIPKGTIVISCIWTILHDPTIYPDPFEFKPERFIKEGKFNHNIVDPYAAVFGHGRRICPGRYFADETIYIMTVSLLAAFNITAPLDETGRPKTLVCEMSGGIISSPEPFECVIKPRSEVAAELIRDNEFTS
ncbi:hypothetical protein M422DRAFT_229524 [Sphaerobolus stellatus SS14]|uniref:Unplaced genomic scaffold SPHSTscaffold_60, whole genome shotgun sequence n=1 Tax=Sphaerobolus stellatus (strain SS14) TaxID=990650 RepID=A0A0C9UFA8_SPHS4|nr:hypothetical protein M422DRAFT_229524 [Sphaerobolus stellatus SS14]